MVGETSNRRRFLEQWRRREVLTVLALGIISMLLWRLPGFEWLLYPFRLFNTFVHELSHGLAAVATGGSFRRFMVHADLTGTAWSAGGIRWIVSSAGYIGSALFGGLLTILSARGVSARAVLFGLGLALGGMCILWVTNAFGVIAGLLLAGALCLAGRQLPKLWADTLLLLLAVQMMLNGLESVLDLVIISRVAPSLTTDAQIMAQYTGVPALVWAMLWSVIAVVILVLSLRVAYRRPPTPPVEQQLVGVSRAAAGGSKQ